MSSSSWWAPEPVSAAPPRRWPRRASRTAIASSGRLERKDSGVDVARHDPDGRRAGASPDHRTEVGAAVVLRPVGVVDAIVDRPVNWLEGDLFRHARGDDAPGLLPHSSSIPARVLSVIAAHVEGAVDRDRPDPCRRAGRGAVLTKRRDVQIVGIGDLAQFVFRPTGHLRTLLV